MQQTFLFATVAVIVGPWHTRTERGARVEVRLLADEAQRGSRAAAQRIVIDQPIFRADLFDRVRSGFKMDDVDEHAVDVQLFWFAIVVTILLFAQIHSAAAWMLVPYIVWVTFAASLNFTIWRLNR